MNFKKLTEQLEKYTINEISDNLKASYLKGKQAKLDKAKSDMEKAKKMVAKSDARQIANLPEGTDKETAKEALEELKYLMKRIDNGSDWRLNLDEDNCMCLEVRYWGEWEGDDGSGDYDWQTLSNESRIELNNILKKVQKGYNVQIREIGSEKNWLVFEIPVTKLTKDSVLDITTELELNKLLKDVNADNLLTAEENDLVHIYFTIKLYNTDSYRPYLEDIDCDLYIDLINKTVMLKIQNAQEDVDLTDDLDFDSLTLAFDYIKQLIKDRNEEVENAKKAKQVKREYAVWLDGKLLKEYPQVKKLKIIDDQHVELQTREDFIKLEKKLYRKKFYVFVDKNGTKTKTVLEGDLDFKAWVEVALQNI